MLGCLQLRGSTEFFIGGYLNLGVISRMSIRQIRWFQRTCQISFWLAALMVTLVLAAIFQLYNVSGQTGNLLSVAFLGFFSFGILLSLVVKQLRCPVCHYTFVGVEDSELFTHTCRNCGRRAGDTG